jgi:hypothetical protein
MVLKLAVSIALRDVIRRFPVKPVHVFVTLPKRSILAESMTLRAMSSDLPVPGEIESPNPFGISTAKDR